MDAVDLAELKRSAMMYSLYCNQNSLRQIADEVGMSKQSVASRLKTLERQIDKIAAIAAYSPTCLDYLIRVLVQLSSEVGADVNGNPASPEDVQRAIVGRLQTAAAELSERIVVNPTPGQSLG